MEYLYMIEHEVEGDPTFSCKEDNHQMHVLCNAFHVGKVLSPFDNWDTDIDLLGTEMHVPEDQAFSEAALFTSKYNHIMISTSKNINLLRLINMSRYQKSK